MRAWLPIRIVGPFQGSLSLPSGRWAPSRCPTRARPTPAWQMGPRATRLPKTQAARSPCSSMGSSWRRPTPAASCLPILASCRATWTVTELFAIEWMGGAAEHFFRRARPATDDIPWDSLDPAQYREPALTAARRVWTEVAISEYAAIAAFSLMVGTLAEARAPL